MKPIAAILAFAHAGEIDWEARDFVGLIFHNFADEAVIFVPEWEAKSLKWVLCCDALPGVAHANVAPRYVEGICASSMSRLCAKAM